MVGREVQVIPLVETVILPISSPTTNRPLPNTVALIVLAANPAVLWAQVIPSSEVTTPPEPVATNVSAP